MCLQSFAGVDFKNNIAGTGSTAAGLRNMVREGPAGPTPDWVQSLLEHQSGLTLNKSVCVFSVFAKYVL
jgi:hypothetical protein